MSTQELGPNQKKWVEALRSGKYVQGTGALCRGGSYCCLGVACEVILPSETRRVKMPPAPHFTEAVEWDGEGGHAPGSLVQSIALRGDCGDLKSAVSKLYALTNLNDRGWTFEDIADLIEADPANVFTEAR